MPATSALAAKVNFPEVWICLRKMSASRGSSPAGCSSLLPSLARRDRRSAAHFSASSDPPGRFARGPEAKQGLFEDLLGFMFEGESQLYQGFVEAPSASPILSIDFVTFLCHSFSNSVKGIVSL